MNGSQGQVPLSVMLIALQKEISQASKESRIAVAGTTRALLQDDVEFEVTFRFTPVVEEDPAGGPASDAILVDHEGAHEMTLRGRISPRVTLEKTDG